MGEKINRVSCWIDKYGAEWVSIHTDNCSTMYPVSGWGDYFTKVDIYERKEFLNDK